MACAHGLVSIQYRRHSAISRRIGDSGLCEILSNWRRQDQPPCWYSYSGSGGHTIGSVPAIHYRLFSIYLQEEDSASRTELGEGESIAREHEHAQALWDITGYTTAGHNF